ncbi:unnamed protein product [Leptidea sinapis]|uniref:Uncharacterized protein n=1 Tax=Leptidea sinapis TaxID=189913 RepID=A0A5E4QJQ8_9NEOP|nr:unnamed protein product [Leptidea sinapis]
MKVPWPLALEVLGLEVFVNAGDVGHHLLPIWTLLLDHILDVLETTMHLDTDRLRSCEGNGEVGPFVVLSQSGVGDSPLSESTISHLRWLKSPSNNEAKYPAGFIEHEGVDGENRVPFSFSLQNPSKLGIILKHRQRVLKTLACKLVQFPDLSRPGLLFLRTKDSMAFCCREASARCSSGMFAMLPAVAPAPALHGSTRGTHKRKHMRQLSLHLCHRSPAEDLEVSWRHAAKRKYRQTLIHALATPLPRQLLDARKDSTRRVITCILLKFDLWMMANFKYDTPAHRRMFAFKSAT